MSNHQLQKIKSFTCGTATGRRGFSSQVVVKRRGHGFSRKRIVVKWRERWLRRTAVQYNEGVEVKRETGKDSEEEEDWMRSARMLRFILIALDWTTGNTGVTLSSVWFPSFIQQQCSIRWFPLVVPECRAPCFGYPKW